METITTSPTPSTPNPEQTPIPQIQCLLYTIDQPDSFIRLPAVVCNIYISMGERTLAWKKHMWHVAY